MIYRTSVSTGALLAILLVGPPKFLLAQTSTVTCSSKEGERQLCPADTAAGVAFQRSLGSAECLLGKTWGYDGAGIWVTDGCSGEFALGQVTAPAEPTVSAPPTRQPIETWGAVEPGKGFLVGRTDFGELSISAYALVRYLNQLPANQTFID